MTGRCDRSARVAVVIPLYGQAHFLVEAVGSVLRQTEPGVVAVIVNDGCPDPASHRAGQTLALAHPERVVYLRQRNSGLSGARNTGIRYALGAFDQLDGIFPLDSDNFLDHRAIERLLGRLAAEPTADWVAPHLQMFGELDRPWRLVPRFTRFRQLFENQADAAALFRPDVFRNGAVYDERMRHGYEDWEMYLDRLLSGAQGVTEPSAVMHYRSRPSSMLANAAERHETIRAYMRAKHRRWYLPRGQTLLEHEDLPRFALVDEHGSVHTFTDPARPGPALESGRGVRAPIAVIARRSAVEQLTRLGLWRGLLYSAQPAHPSDVTVVTLGTAGAAGTIELDHRERRTGAAASLVVLGTDFVRRARHDTSALADALWSAREISVAHPRLLAPASWSDADLIRLVGQFGHRVSDVPAGQRTDLGAGLTSDDDFAAHLHATVVQSTFPLADDGATHVGFMMPWLRLGGVEHCVLQIARAMRSLDPDVRIHLALTESGIVATDPELTSSLFDSITSFAGIAWDRRVAMAERWGASMDLMVNAHSGVGFAAVRGRPSAPPGERHSTDVAYLHVLDMTADGMRHGWPIVAARDEPMIDRFLVISRRLAALMMNEGVPSSKIVLGPNAPVVRPDTVEAACRLAHLKAERLAAGGELRVLIAGRLDHQKGGRRAAIAIRRLVEEGRRLHVTVLGEATLEAELPELPEGSCTWRGATSDLGELSGAFSDADVLLLLSRWEGVPLAMLDAMAHGVLVVATDVGAIGEVAVDGDTARLIPCEPRSTDDEIAEEAVRVLGEVIDDPTGGRASRERAVERAWGLSWDDTARTVLEMAASSRKGQQC